MEAVDIQKDLMKSKTMADFDRFENGKLYYNIIILGAPYQFPVAVVESRLIDLTFGDDLVGKIQKDSVSGDVKGAAFTPSMRGSELFRWIKKAYNNNDLVKLGQD